jgi:hypothetical protein
MPLPDVIRLPIGFYDPDVKNRVLRDQSLSIKPGAWLSTADADPLAEILRRLRQLQVDPVGALGEYIVEKRGGLWVAEDP